MAGHVLKIILDNTRPPVWRRVIVPEKITFADLHEIIQILFGWDDYHLHDFQIPSRRISIDMEESFFGSSHYTENKTLLEQFFPEIGRIRYTYDFGDQWTHTIMYEKTDESYTKRHASFLKAKGDNFAEDSGGLWSHCEYGENRVPFDEITVSQRLESLIFPVRDNVSDTSRDLSEEDFEELLNKDLTEEEIQAVADDFLKYLHDFLKKYPLDDPDAPDRDMDEPDMDFLTDAPDMSFLTDAPDMDFLTDPLDAGFLNKKTKQSQMSKKIDLWKDFARYGKAGVMEIVPGSRTNAELLYALNRTEAADYCKYLRIPVKNGCTKKQMTDAVGKAFQEHPEYLLYVLTEEDYKELSRFMKLPCGAVSEQPQTETMIRALALGLVDLTVSQKKGLTKIVLSFASDLQELLKPLNASLRKKTCRFLKNFSDKAEQLILGYGMIKLENMEELFEQIYHEGMEPEAFYRCVYWHLRFNNRIQTGYSDDMTCYAAALQLDMEIILKNMQKYAGDMDYVVFTATKLKQMYFSISNRSTWMELLFSDLHYQLKLSEEESAEMLEDLFVSIVNCRTLPEILDDICGLLPRHLTLAQACDLWVSVSSLMMELELPMLKGRSRQDFERETGLPAWQTGMLPETITAGNTKDRRMCEFPAKIQESMELAHSFASMPAMKELLQYKKKEHIVSEEFLYLLADAHITACEASAADSLIQELRRSSRRGKEAADLLMRRLKDMPDDDFEDEFPWEFLPESQTMPVMRRVQKIGRNEPCPCGSGKKYKKCCGRNL